MAHLGVTFRLRPTPQQERQLASIAGACRSLWNAALEQRQTAWQRSRTHVSWVAQSAEVKDLRTAIPFMAKPPCVALQQVLRDLDKAFANWWSGRARAPRWKSAKRTPPAFRVCGRALRVVGRQVQLPKVGCIRAFVSRGLPGRIVNATVTRRAGRWYVSFICEVADPTPAPHAGGVVGIDLGVANTLSLSTGEQVSQPTPTDRERRALVRAQRRMARRRRGSRGWRKAHHAIARLTETWAARREDFAAKAANDLTDRFALIAIEDLSASRMTRRGRGKTGLNRALLEQAFRSLRTRLEQKAPWTGAQVVAVPAQYSSQTCSLCGHVDRRSRESQAEFRCVSCGYELHADVNAARVILSRAGQARLHAGGVSLKSGRTTNPEPCATSAEASHDLNSRYLTA